jgi:hypothetical protein
MKKKRVTKTAGLLSWLLFVGFAIVGEVISHFVFSAAYEGLGDNPSQVAGLTVVLFFSPFVNLIVWFICRYQSRKT